MKDENNPLATLVGYLTTDLESLFNTMKEKLDIEHFPKPNFQFIDTKTRPISSKQRKENNVENCLRDGGKILLKFLNS